MRGPSGSLCLGGPGPLPFHLEKLLWCAGMSALPSRAEREWAPGCAPLPHRSTAHRPCPLALPLAQAASAPSFWLHKEKRALFCKGCEYFDLPPSRGGVCVPSLLPGLGREGSGLLPGSLAELFGTPT